MDGSRTTWPQLLALLVGAAAASSCSSGGGDTPNYPADHPCFGKDACDSYLELPDGGLTTVPEGGIPEGAVTRVCGSCNG